MVWENVPGAFSSNGGKDFAAVLEEAVRIVEPQAPFIPVPDKGWPSAGCLSDMDGKWSIAWRVHDAQFWGVPQRRKRIALVCDFGGHTAPEILFERKGLHGDTAEGGTAREEIARTAGNGIEGASGFTNRGYFTGGIAETLRSDPHGAYPHVYGIGNGQVHEAITMAQEVSQTLNTMHDKQAILYQPKSMMEENWAESETKNALRAGESKVSHAVLCSAVDCRNFTEGGEINGTLQAKESGGQSLNLNNTVRQNMIARRVTPLECERLQGYPDGWTDIGEWIDSKGKKHKAADSPRYKALGNSIALPFWFWLLRRISAQYERPATLGSLFDGIGGFPLCWERCNGKGTALWASEIEEFPMAVTKKRFGEG
jgi:DNA (cytosine-5)-methyltransferase 1